MSRLTAPPRRYRLLIRVLSPVLLLWVLLIAWRQARERNDAMRFVRERLGVFTPTDKTQPQPRWLHAASVGEVLTALPLIQAVPAEDLLVTTTTATGAEVLRKRAPGVRHRYLPIDWPGAVQRFITAEQPRSAWIIETEIWPWLFAHVRAHDISLSIVNGRLSERTLNGANRGMATIYRHALRDLDVLARSQTDADRYRALGASRVAVTGDLKRAVPIAPIQPQALIDQPYHLAASTHDDEEVSLAKAWMDADADALLVIAPRHPERGDKLQTQLSSIAGHSLARRASAQSPKASDRIYLADTLGELDAWYAHASTVFVGGSLITRGGHNLMEPARAARAIACGKHTDNFQDVTAALVAADALFQADTARDIVHWMLNQSDAGMGARAQQVAAQDATILERYVSALIESSDSRHTD